MNRKKYVTRWSYTDLQPEMKQRQDKVQVGTEAVEKTSIMGKKKLVEKPVFEIQTKQVATGKSIETMPNLADLATRIEDLCNGLHDDGYDVLSIMPVQFGNFNFATDKNHEMRSFVADGGGGYGWGHGYGYGFGLTRGVIVTGQDREN